MNDGLDGLNNLEVAGLNNDENGLNNLEAGLETCAFVTCVRVTR
jgi:hypothetical protein